MFFQCKQISYLQKKTHYMFNLFLTIVLTIFILTKVFSKIVIETESVKLIHINLSVP